MTSRTSRSWGRRSASVASTLRPCCTTTTGQTGERFFGALLPGRWKAQEAENVARMRLQNRFRTGLDIARYTARIMRADMAAYDADPANYTQSLGCWHGFIGQQKMISIKKHFGTTKRRYLYLSGWMVAALRSEFGPLPDQSMHEKTSVPALIEELYTFLRQADARELGMMFRELDKARKDQGRSERMLAEIPLRRRGHPREVASVIDFLCGEGSTYITGQILNVDGGIVNS